MDEQEKKDLLRDKLGITGEPLKPEDFSEDGRYLLPRSRRGLEHHGCITTIPIFDPGEDTCLFFTASNGKPILILHSVPPSIEIPDGVSVDAAAQGFLEVLATLGYPPHKTTVI